MKQMNKILITLTLMLVTAMLVSAGSFEKTCYFFGHEYDCSQSGEIDADSIDGKTLGQIKGIMNRKDNNVKSECKSYADANDAVGGGIGSWKAREIVHEEIDPVLQALESRLDIMDEALSKFMSMTPHKYQAYMATFSDDGCYEGFYGRTCITMSK